jgi:hypothetical protein
MKQNHLLTPKQNYGRQNQRVQYCNYNTREVNICEETPKGGKRQDTILLTNILNKHSLKAI